MPGQVQDADQLLRSGDLDGARGALIDVVRSEPANQPARMFLFQVLALAGEWERAAKQLTILGQLSGEAQMLAATYHQAITAEAERAEVFAGRSRARQHIASEWVESLIDAIQHFACGRVAEGVAARDAAFDGAPDTPGVFNGAAFDWIGDADSRFGPCFEAIIGGRYGLQAFDGVERIESEGPRDLRDTVWYPVQIAFRNGQSVAALLPARYPGTESVETPMTRIGRGTDWAPTEWGDRGIGQHLWTLSTGEDRDLLSLRTLAFD